MSLDTQQWGLGKLIPPPTLLLHVLSFCLMTCCTFIFSDLVMTTRIPDDKHGTVVSSSEWSLCLWRELLLSHNLCGRSEDGELTHSHVITLGAEIHNETTGIQTLPRCIFSQGMLHVEDFHPCMTQAKLKDGLGLYASLFIFPLDITSRCASTEKAVMRCRKNHCRQTVFTDRLNIWRKWFGFKMTSSDSSLLCVCVCLSKYLSLSCFH